MNKLNITHLEHLLEKYYEGITTVSDEKELAKLLLHPNLPDRFFPDRDMLAYFTKEKQKKTTKLIPFVKWGSVAAIFLIMFLALSTLTTKEANYAYIDGEKITDSEIVLSQALASIKMVSSQNEIEETFQLLSDNDIIEQQLSIFADF